MARQVKNPVWHLRLLKNIFNTFTIVSKDISESKFDMNHRLSVSRDLFLQVYIKDYLNFLNHQKCRKKSQFWVTVTPSVIECLWLVTNSILNVQRENKTIRNHFQSPIFSKLLFKKSCQVFLFAKKNYFSVMSMFAIFCQDIQIIKYILTLQRLLKKRKKE